MPVVSIVTSTEPSNDGGPNVIQRKKSVVIVTPPVPSSDGEQDKNREQSTSVSCIAMSPSVPEGQQAATQRRGSFSLHGDRRGSDISRRMSVSGGNMPLVLREEDAHSIS